MIHSYNINIAFLIIQTTVSRPDKYKTTKIIDINDIPNHSYVFLIRTFPKWLRIFQEAIILGKTEKEINQYLK